MLSHSSFLEHKKLHCDKEHSWELNKRVVWAQTSSEVGSGTIWVRYEAILPSVSTPIETFIIITQQNGLKVCESNPWG